MNAQNSWSVTILIGVIVTLSLIGIGWYVLKEGARITHKQQDTAQRGVVTDARSPSEDADAANSNDYAGIIDTSTDGVRNVYTSAKYGLRFTYPQGWRVGDNHLGYGTLQLFNYAEDEILMPTVFNWT